MRGSTRNNNSEVTSQYIAGSIGTHTLSITFLCTNFLSLNIPPAPHHRSTLANFVSSTGRISYYPLCHHSSSSQRLHIFTPQTQTPPSSFAARCYGIQISRTHPLSPSQLLPQLCASFSSAIPISGALNRAFASATAHTLCVINTPLSSPGNQPQRTLYIYNTTLTSLFSHSSCICNCANSSARQIFNLSATPSVLTYFKHLRIYLYLFSLHTTIRASNL